MSNCKQKVFLGVDSIDVLIKYIDNKIEENSSDVRVCTLQLFKYFKSTDDLNLPDKDIFYDFDTATISFPSNYEDSWNTLKNVMDSLNDDDLANGSIYTSTRVQQGINGASEDDLSAWSKPVKISGENGKTGENGINFAFSYNPEFNPEDYLETAPELTEENNIIYYWIYRNELPEAGTPGSTWAKYTTDGKDGVNGTEMHYQYFVTSVDDADKNNKPVRPNDNASWSETIMDVSKDYPYLWVRSQQTVAGEAINDENWSDPKLLSKYGQDGTAPEYNMTLYKWSEGYLKPDQPILGEFNEETGKYEFIKLDDFRANNPDWLDVPTLDAATPAAIDVESIVEVSTVQDITDNLVNGNTIKLSEDLQIPTPIIITEGNVTIDLNGHTITAGNFMESNGEVLEGDTDSYVFWVKGGHLTIQGNGKVVASPAKYSIAVWSNGGDVTIKGGRYENGGESCDLIYGSARTVDGVRQGGTIKIYGGEFYATLIGEEAGTGNKRSALNTKNADMDICKIEVYGGYFHEFDPSNNLSLPGSTGNFLGEGVKLINNNGVFEVVNNLLPNIWWQCTIKINGAKEEVMQIGTVERYSAIDGAALPGEYTKLLFKWSENQLMPELDKSENNLIDGWKPEGWEEDPNTNIIEGPEVSVWMIVCNVNGIKDNGSLNVMSISDPVKITGPRGSLSYDYRIEMRYYCGNEKSPKHSPTSIQWHDNIDRVSLSDPKYPYLWAYPVLVYYKMRYGELNDDGTYSIETYGNPVIVKGQKLTPYRMSGTNGTDGNTKNNILVTETSEPVYVDNFSINNYFIYTGVDEVNYNLNFNEIDFISGYTGKFTNAGNGTVKINVSGKYTFIGSGKTSADKITAISLATGETVELIVYNNGAELSFIVVGKNI